MPSQPNSHGLGERLLFTTLAIDDAISSDDWIQVETLLQSRQGILDEIDGGVDVPVHILQRSADAQVKALEKVHREQKTVRESLRGLRVSSTASKAYRAGPRRTTDISLSA